MHFTSHFFNADKHIHCPPEFLHRAADLTLVPSAAIAKDLEAYRVTAGENFFVKIGVGYFS